MSHRYVNNLNNMTKDTERKPLEHYITNEKGPLHNQAAQVLIMNCSER